MVVNKNIDINIDIWWFRRRTSGTRSTIAQHRDGLSHGYNRNIFQPVVLALINPVTSSKITQLTSDIEYYMIDYLHY